MGGTKCTRSYLAAVKLTSVHATQFSSYGLLWSSTWNNEVSVFYEVVGFDFITTDSEPAPSTRAHFCASSRDNIFRKRFWSASLRAHWNLFTVPFCELPNWIQITFASPEVSRWLQFFDHVLIRVRCMSYVLWQILGAPLCAIALREFWAASFGNCNWECLTVVRGTRQSIFWGWWWRWYDELWENDCLVTVSEGLVTKLFVAFPIYNCVVSVEES